MINHKMAVRRANLSNRHFLIITADEKIVIGGGDGRGGRDAHFVLFPH